MLSGCMVAASPKDGDTFCQPYCLCCCRSQHADFSDDSAMRFWVQGGAGNDIAASHVREGMSTKLVARAPANSYAHSPVIRWNKYADKSSIYAAFCILAKGLPMLRRFLQRPAQMRKEGFIGNILRPAYDIIAVAKHHFDAARPKIAGKTILVFHRHTSFHI